MRFRNWPDLPGKSVPYQKQQYSIYHSRPDAPLGLFYTHFPGPGLRSRRRNPRSPGKERNRVTLSTAKSPGPEKKRNRVTLTTAKPRGPEKERNPVTLSTAKSRGPGKERNPVTLSTAKSQGPGKKRNRVTLSTTKSSFSICTYPSQGNASPPYRNKKRGRDDRPFVKTTYH